MSAKKKYEILFVRDYIDNYGHVGRIEVVKSWSISADRAKNALRYWKKMFGSRDKYQERTETPMIGGAIWSHVVVETAQEDGGEN